MGAKTEISWTDSTWNPIRGCSRVSEGCRNCYAEAVAYRFSGPGGAYEGLVRIGADGERRREWNGQVRFVEKHLLDPLKWKEPRRIFVNSMSDLFHENVTDEMRNKIFAVMGLCRAKGIAHKFQVLTKRPANGLRYYTLRSREWATQHFMAVPGLGDVACDLIRFGMEGAHLGVSCEDQATADERIPLLLQTPAAVRFISAEPLLGGLDIERYLHKRVIRVDEALTQRMVEDGWSYPGGQGDYKPLDWVIVGGESGPGARPMHPDWARSLRDQCKAAGVAFFFKQWGEWAIDHEAPNEMDWSDGHALVTAYNGDIRGSEALSDETTMSMWKAGKHAAGAMLDGREWREFPA